MVNHAGNANNLKFANTLYGKPSDEVLAHINRYMIFHEDEGAVRWGDETPGPRAYPNAVCGTLRADGYRVIRVKGKQYMAGRVAWYLHTGRWPSGAMAFADKNTDNFRPDNMWESGTEPPEAFQKRVLDHRAGKPEAQPISPEKALALDAAREARFVIEDIRPNYASIEGTTEYDEYEHTTHSTRAFLEHLGVQHKTLDDLAAAELALALQ